MSPEELERRRLDALLYYNGYHETDRRELQRRRQCQRDIIELSQPVVDVLVDILNFHSTPYLILDRATGAVVESGHKYTEEGQRRLDIANTLLLEIRQSVLEAYNLEDTCR